MSARPISAAFSRDGEMPPADRSPAEALFLAAADADAPARAALLAAAPPNVRAEAEALLRADAESEAFFQRPRGLTLLGEAPPPPEAGLELRARVGPYRVVEVAGHGGMGTVYRAERDDGLFQQTVALKVVRLGMATADVLTRAAAERQALARLQHPGIARLLDAGETPDGRPFLAMEFVDGKPLLDYAEAEGLTVEGRLGLFLQVCEAVAAAHRALLVHRDLKPSNVLVTETEDGPRVVLLDFGIAKALDGDDDFTRTSLRTFTPAYAAPEQCAGGPITTAVDVWALGALLYELLTGGRATDSKETTRTRPSTAVLSQANGGSLARRLRGDLDAVVARALRDEPEARYRSVPDLADDVRRHLGGFPVLARQGTTRYLASRFVRRHRAEVAAAAALVVLAAAFVGLLLDERARTRAALTEAEGVTAFLLDIFEQSDPSEARGHEVTAREMLDRGARQIRTDPDLSPARRADLLATMGRAYRQLGLAAPAESLLTEALALRRKASGDEAPAVGEALSDLAELLYGEGRYPEAERLYRGVLGILRQEHPDDHPAVLAAMNGLAAALFDQKRYEESERLNREVLAARRAQRDPLVGQSLHNLGSLLRETGRYDEAEPFLDEMLAIAEAAPPQAPERAFALTEVARLYIATGRAPEAEPLVREGLALRRKVLPPDHWLTGVSEAILGQALLEQGRYEAGRRLIENGLAKLEAHRGSDERFVRHLRDQLAGAG